MKTDDIRRYNLRQYIKKMEIEQKQLAVVLGKSPAQVSAVIGQTPRRNIGSKLARHIEERLQKPVGWLDTLQLDEDEQATPDYIWIRGLKIKGTRGFSALSVQLEPVKKILISEAWLSANTDSSPQSLQIAEAKGMGMEPIIRHGELLLIDVTTTQFDHDGVYVLRFEIDQILMLRRLYRDSTGVMVAANSLNLARNDSALGTSGLIICGKVSGSFKFTRI